MRRGASQAVNDLNNAGGVLGQKVKLVVRDDACDTRKTLIVAKNLVSQKVVFVAGHFCSNSSIVASKIYMARRILQISPASTNPKLTDEGGSNVFRVCGRDDQQGVLAGKLLSTKFAGKKIAFVHNKTAYGKGLVDTALENYQKGGGKVAMVKAYTAGQKDYTALISKMKAARIDVFYLGGNQLEGARIIRQAHEMQYRPQLFHGGDALVTDVFWKNAGNAAEGMLVIYSPDPRNNKRAKPVVDKFRAQNLEPKGYTLYTYGAIQTWAAAVTMAGSTDLNKVTRVMHSKHFDTVLGRISFNKRGDIKLPHQPWHVGRLMRDPTSGQTCCNDQTSSCCPGAIRISN